MEKDVAAMACSMIISKMMMLFRGNRNKAAY